MESSESKPSKRGPSETGPSETGPSESGPSESGPSESGPSENRPAESRPAESRPAESRPAESRPAESRPAESRPAESKPAESRPTASRPAENRSSESRQSENRPSLIGPSENKSSESGSSESGHSESRPPDNRRSEIKLFGHRPPISGSSEKRSPDNSPEQSDTKLSVSEWSQSGQPDFRPPLDRLSFQRPPGSKIADHLIVAQLEVSDNKSTAGSYVQENVYGGKYTKKETSSMKFKKMVFGDPAVEWTRTKSRIEKDNKKEKSEPEIDDSDEHRVVRPKKGKAYFRYALRGNRDCIHSMFPFRCIFALMAAISFAIIYGLKVNLSITIVAMVNHTKAHDQSVFKSKECPKPSHTEDVQDGPFNWNAVDQSHVLSSYFYGYMPTQIPGAILAKKYNAKWVMLAGVASNIIAAALTPPFAYSLGIESVIVLRVIQGLGGGLTFPAMHEMLSKWAPAAQRSIFSGIIYSGISIGMVGSVLIGGFVSHQIGWEWVFYLMAILSVPWCFFWALWITDYPPDFLGEKEKFLKFPIKEVFKSAPFWAIIVAHFCGNCGLYMVITVSPLFFKKVLFLNMKSNAVFSAIPYVLMYIVSVGIGTLFDYLRQDKITTTVARKLAAIISMALPGSCLIGMSFIGCNATAGLAIYTVAVAGIGAQTCSYLSNHLDISPTHAGLLMGITNTIATIPGMVIPPIIGLLTDKDESLERWSIAFYGIACLYIVGFIVFFFLASGARQPWDQVPDTT